MTMLHGTLRVAIFFLAIAAPGTPALAQQPMGAGVPQPPAATSPQPVVAPDSAAKPAAESRPEPVPPASAAAVEPAPRSAAGVGSLRELSPWSMFLSADLLVKIVMISLIFASLVTWTILLAKSVQLSRARRAVGGALARIAKSRSLNEARLALGATENVVTALLSAAAQEIEMSADSGLESGVKERAASQFSEILRMEARAVRHGMGTIATIGATAPFVGLFGTVWGIMNSFIGISQAQTTNLAVVAPGIAEALLATATGLAAAIPAVIIYNHFARATKSYLDLVGRGSGAIGRLLSRDLDRFHSRMMSRAAE